MSFTYVLWSKKLSKRYIGSAADVTARLTQHNRGKSRFTSGGIPWVLLHQEFYPTFADARKREAFLKSGAGRKWLDENLPNPH